MFLSDVIMSHRLWLDEDLSLMFLIQNNDIFRNIFKPCYVMMSSRQQESQLVIPNPVFFVLWIWRHQVTLKQKAGLVVFLFSLRVSGAVFDAVMQQTEGSAVWIGISSRPYFIFFHIFYWCIIIIIIINLLIIVFLGFRVNTFCFCVCASLYLNNKWLYLIFVIWIITRECGVVWTRAASEAH